MSIRNSIQALHEEISAYRRELHQNPQTSYEEVFASDFVAEKLSAWGVKHERGIAVTGIVATIEGERNTSGKAIALRADMDALNIEEDPTGKPHASKNKGKMHACGHDGHTAMLLGAAKYLSENRNFDGTVHLIFQPAEEGDGGAHKMIEEGLFDRFPCDQVFGMHNWPDMPLGEIAMRAGPTMAAADRFDIAIYGKGGHAARPQGTIDPIIMGTHIVSALQTLVSRSTGPLDSAVLSITNIHIGTGAFNVIAEHGTMSGTLRTLNPETRKFLHQRIIEMTENTAQNFGGHATCVFAEGSYDPTINDPAATAFCADIARDIVGADNVDTDIDPSMGAEDFGAMLQEKPGCYIMMGQATGNPDSHHNQGLHTPRYDFNDDLIPQGIEYWVRVVEKALPLKK